MYTTYTSNKCNVKSKECFHIKCKMVREVNSS